MNQAMQGFQQGLVQGGKKPRMRNAIMTLLIPIIVIVAANILGTILVIATGSAIVAQLCQLISLVGLVLYYMPVFQMTNEVRSVTKEVPFPVWFFLIPIYGWILWFTKLPAEVAKAKQMVGAQQPVRGLILYLLFVPYALAADVNDIAARMPPG